MATEQVKEQAAAAAGTAVEQSKEVASTATQQVGEVAAQAKEQTVAVAGQAKVQVHQLVSQAATEARAQGNQQTEKLAEGLRSIAGQLQAFAEGRTEEAGQLPDYARQATDHLQQLAGRLGDGGVDGVLHELQRVARRKPGTFLASAALAGFVGGRLLRGAKAGAPSTPAGSLPGATPPLSPASGLPAAHGAIAGATAGPDEVVVLTEPESVTGPGTTGVVSTPVGGI